MDPFVVAEVNADFVAVATKVCIPVEENKVSGNVTVYTKIRAVTITYCGSYENGVIAYEKIKEYILMHHLTPAGYPREFYLEGNFDNDHDNNIVYIAVPIE